MMSDQPHDLCVAYRVSPNPSQHAPPVHADDKFALTELCLASFKGALGGLRAKVFVIMDGCPVTYEKLFLRHFDREDLVFIQMPFVGNEATFHEQARILRHQHYADVVYFAEDDYLYFPGSMLAAVKAMDWADFVSLYRHPDQSRPLHYLRRPEVRDGWRETVSTTMTFMTRRSVLAECEGVVQSDYYGLMPDLALWLALTKRRVFNLIRFLDWLVDEPFWAGSIVLAWLLFWRQILFGRRFGLFTPQSTLATHMVAGKEAPGVDWAAEIARQQRRVI